ncbi:benzaldehyde dehydrogenase [Planosporangium flavigriseum]|uniref:Aldehyde dehydrogenase n=1 Tax=Planosporangium flavigriseum TaxID=373681 RepID=A0A8J3LZC0_9ACTN|nr:benzaldehyde dehydrogenase [Planosporangium flavigriseum]NJC65661.1 benzaldehyde dehydrogenase [Planosporangium flavigriseum]GIG76524.1 aldehyde dehydrogenase [Planosporangium flavigriseum]
MALLDDGTWQGKIWTGSWTEATGGTYTAVEPATGESLGEVGRATPADVSAAADRAVAAQRAWAALPYAERARVLRRAGQLMEEHADEIKGWLARESGAIGPFGDFQVHTSAAECYEASALPSHPYGELLRTGAPRLSFARRVPAGVVGVIAPFNVPTILAIRAVAPALALGNAVILKPDPRTAISGGAMFARVFEEAGLPAGVLQVLPGGADVGEALVVEPAVRIIAFTGSTRAGRAVGALAGQHLKRAHLELGGNSALIVLPDVDVAKAASVGAFGTFSHQGQICMATSRHLVHSSIAEEYTRILTEKVEKLPVGDPYREQVALGPLIDAGQRDRVHGLVTASVDAGATVRTGGTFEGLFYRPTVLGDVPVDAPAYREEIFGPVAPVTPFSSLDEVAELAAGTEYGLSLGILTRDVYKGLELAERIPSGLVHINDQTINDEAVAPFGGVGASGTGSRHGGPQANIEAFTETQWVTVRGDLPAYPF